ncbi:MAG: tRNA (N(6)-L-threonylcarbamoyladenosine(37)-C(2))-methylthiotransferase MtaB [Lachnospiraceae bacterium]|nr:tRNA (N(6)-L-threonylcarbamoyladenosine(37)-C(2))-methylthiotransferase MtaB [Lachnospiraceae bacterium]
MNKKKAALHNLGCKVNAYETEAMQQLLEEDGYEIVEFHEKADVYVINTCSVTNMADRKSRQMLHRAKKLNPDSIVVAAGCYVQTKTDEAKLDEAIDIIIGNNKKHELISAIEAFEKSREDAVSVIEINHKQEYEYLHMTKTAEHTRAFIKVQDGCNQFCTYCIIPYARGRVRSRELSDVLEEITTLSANGYKEVVLTGIHLSSYGVDTGDSLLHLIQETAKIEGIKRIRLGSLEPRIVTEEFVSAIADIDKICPHFHLSLQSGCDATLERMNRRYTTEEYAKGCEILRKYFTHPAITTDVIVGFPGETEEEFALTKEYLERIHFYEMHVFKYSKREGTKAAVMPNQVSEQVKTKRSAALLALEKEMSNEYREYYMGKEVEVLMEEPVVIDGECYFTGYTKEYVKIAVKTDKMLANTFIKGKVTRKLSADLFVVEF